MGVQCKQLNTDHQELKGNKDRSSHSAVMAMTKQSLKLHIYNTQTSVS